MKNGMKLYDDRGEALHAHGGYMLEENGWYYWFGENRTGRIRVSCYKSRNLEHWMFAGHVLTLDAPVKKHYIEADLSMEKDVPDKEGNLVFTGCNIERPKVLFHKRTGRYVMWMHYEDGVTYKAARCAVAVCDRIDGVYTYLGSFNPSGNMSRDCTVFQEEDGTAYFISAGNSNADTVIYRLTEDYLSIEEEVQVLWPGEFREAASVLKRDGIYYMLTSGCTGWHPNQGKYAWAESMTGEWSPLYYLGDETTYRSQPAFVLPLTRRGRTKYLYVGDRWCAENYEDSTYLFWPIVFDGDRKLHLEHPDEWHLR